MASQSRTHEELLIAGLATLGLHGVMACGLIIAGWFLPEPEPTEEDSEVDIEPPPRVARVDPPKIDPVVPQVVPELPAPVPPPVVRTTTAPRVSTARPTVTPEPKVSAEPSSGQEGVPVQGDPIVLPDVFVKGDVEVGQGTRQGSGGGGGPGPGKEPAGEGGTGPPPPVSIAAIKKRAMPVGDVDYVSMRDYPEEARKLGIGGTVKVRLHVDDQGKVTRRTLVVKRGHGLDELAMMLAAKLRFEPALDADDRKVASIVVWSFEFVPPE